MECVLAVIGSTVGVSLARHTVHMNIDEKCSFGVPCIQHEMSKQTVADEIKTRVKT